MRDESKDDFNSQLVTAQLDLLSFIAKLTAGSIDSKDILQRVNLKLLQQRGRYDSARPFLP